MKPLRRRPAPACAARGFTLIELLVACALSLLLVVTLGRTVVSSSATEKTNASAAEIAVNGRFALEYLRRELMHAGFRGLAWAPMTPMTTAVPAVTNDCAAGFALDLAQTIWASNDANPFAASCLPAANYRTGDVLVTRRAAFQPATAVAANTMYLRSSYERAEVFKGSTPPPLFTATPRQDFAVETAVYYVSPWSASASESPPIPGLHRLALGNGPAMTATLVAGNVEDMQLQFARSSSDLRTRFHNANQLNAAATPSEWTEIAAVRVWLLVRASTPEPGYQNNRTYVLGDKTVTVNDGFRREVFSTIVQVRNK